MGSRAEWEHGVSLGGGAGFDRRGPPCMVARRFQLLPKLLSRHPLRNVLPTRPARGAPEIRVGEGGVGPDDPSAEGVDGPRERGEDAPAAQWA